MADYAETLLGALQLAAPAGTVIARDLPAADLRIYHLGNNRLHAEIYRRALAEPGVVVIHDAVLHHFLLGALSPTEYVEEFIYNYGEWSRHIAEELWRDRAACAADPRFFRYPMLRRAVERAKAVIVHNPGAAAIAREHGAKNIHIVPHFYQPAGQPPATTHAAAPTTHKPALTPTPVATTAQTDAPAHTIHAEAPSPHAITSAPSSHTNTPTSTSHADTLPPSPNVSTSATQATTPTFTPHANAPNHPAPDGFAIERFRQRAGIAPGATLFGIFGYLRETKRLIPAIKAFRRLHAVRPATALLIAGDIVSRDLERLLASEPPHPAIHRVGHLPDADFLVAAASVDCCLNLRYPPAGETSGIAIRLMGLGKPVIVTEGPETADIPESACLRVSAGPKETEELFAHMAFIAEFPYLAKDIGQAAASHIRQHHSLESAAMQYLQVIDSIK